jgi:hypothetical protein
MAVLYRHIRLDSNQPFYIGIGKTEKRAYSKKSRNDHWNKIAKKHGYKVQIMLDDLTWEEACQKEIEFIQLYGRKDLGLGTLVNKTDGGEGTVGRKYAEEAIAKMSAASLGKSKPKIGDALRGKPKSEESNAKRSATLTGRVFTEEHKTNLRKPKPKLSAAKKAWWAKKRIENAR